MREEYVCARMCSCVCVSVRVVDVWKMLVMGNCVMCK